MVAGCPGRRAGSFAEVGMLRTFSVNGPTKLNVLT